jgi:predicted dehydrogenase
MTINYGIIGCGMMGQEHIKNINLLDDTKIAAIFEPDASMRDAAAALAPNAVFPESIGALLDLEELDCLVIVSPNYMHIDQLEQISEKVSLPILCEKPLYTNANDAIRVRNLRQSYEAPIWVAMEYRYMPVIAKFVDQVERTTGGAKMLTIREHRFPFLEKVGDWNRFNHKSGGTLVEKCCHFFDLMRLILKSDPVQVMASAGQEVNHLDEVYDGEVSDIWDCGYVIVDFESGARAMLELSMFAEGSEYQENIHAVGPAGKIECFVPGPGRFWPVDMGPAPVAKLVESPRNPMGIKEVVVPVDETLLGAGDHNGSTFYQHQKFLEVVKGNNWPEVTLEDGAWAVAIGLAAQESASQGRAVKINPV